MADFHQVVEGIVIPLSNSILVHNLETTDERIVKGIIIPSEDAQGRGIRPRWAQIWKVGEDITDVKTGEWVLLEHGRWTRGIKLINDKEEVVIRMIDNESILGVQDDMPKNTGGFGDAISLISKTFD